MKEWLTLLAAAQPLAERATRAGWDRRTAVLALLRGAMLDLLATGDRTRTTAGVRWSGSHERDHPRIHGAREGDVRV